MMDINICIIIVFSTTYSTAANH